jgi:glycosyltransferase involved in cell wall biosynthesis
MSDRRICVISYEYPPTGGYFGGIGTQYGALAPNWAASGAEVHVLTTRPRGKEVAAVIDGVHVHALPLPRVLFPWVSATRARRVRAAMKGLGPFDAVISPEFRGEASLYSQHQDAGPLVTHLLTSSAQLLALRPGLTKLARHGPRTRVNLSLERRQADHSRALFAPGGAVLRWARQLWPSIEHLPTRILPLTIEVGRVRKLAAGGELPPGFPARGDRPLVGLASRLDGHKGAEPLLFAMKRVWASHPTAELVFIGHDSRYDGGTMSGRLRALAGEDARRVHFTGALPSDQYFAAVVACDLIAIPSLWESFCLAAVEAMALGVPVIGTSGHGFDEYIRDGDNGLLVERRAVEPLADAVERLLDSPELRTRLGAAARLTADRLDVAEVAPRYLDALTSV